MLAIVSMALTKFSVLQLQRRLCGLQPASRYIKVMHRALAVAIVIWTIFSVFALAFQCGTVSPQTYEHVKCANGVLWYPVTIMNAITDAALAFSFTPIIMALSVRRQTKAKVIILLGARILYVYRTLAHGLPGTDRVQSLHSDHPTSRIARTELDKGRPDKGHDETHHAAADRHESLHADRSRDWLTQFHREPDRRRLWCRSSRLE